MKIRRLLWLAGFLSYIITAQAIDTKALVAEAKRLFPDAPAVLLYKQQQINIVSKDQAPTIESEIVEYIYFQKDEVDYYTKQSVYKSFFSKVEDLKAYTLVNENGKFKQMNVEHFIEKDNVSDNVFYDDLKQISFIFPNVKAGSIGVLSYKVKIADLHFMPSFYFSSYMPVLHTRLNISLPTSVEMKNYLFNSSDKIRQEENTKGLVKTLSWSADSIAPFNNEEASPDYAYYAPHILLSIASYELADKKVSIFANKDGLCNWYSAFVDSANQQPSHMIDSIVTMLTKNVQSDEEKLKRIYYWVQENINYIAFENGFEGMIPKNAEEVCSKRYGDCKGMSSILVKMLQTAQIPAYFTWIGTRHLPYKYSVSPCPLIDNHMICVAEINHQKWIIDGTSKFTPLGMPSSFTQGKECLVRTATGHCEIYTVPIIDANKNSIVDSIFIAYDEKNQSLKGNLSSEAFGYAAVRLKNRYHYEKPEKRIDEFSNLIRVGNNKCTINNLHCFGTTEPDSILRIEATFNLPEYAKTIGNKILFNPHLKKELEHESIDLAERKLDYEIDNKSHFVTVTTMAIPSGYQLDYLPSNVAFNGKKMQAEIEYKKDAEKITTICKITLDFLILPLKNMTEWNEMTNLLTKAYKENIVFKKTNP